VNRVDPDGLIERTIDDFYYQQGYHCIEETDTTALFENSKGDRKTYGNHSRLSRQKEQRP